MADEDFVKKIEKLEDLEMEKFAFAFLLSLRKRKIEICSSVM